VARIDDCVGSFDRVDLVAVERPRLGRQQPIPSFGVRKKRFVRGNFQSKVAVNQLNGSPLSNFVGLG